MCVPLEGVHVRTFRGCTCAYLYRLYMCVPLEVVHVRTFVKDFIYLLRKLAESCEWK